jgi:Carboxypeptidase regulatory-like domain
MPTRRAQAEGVGEPDCSGPIVPIVVSGTVRSTRGAVPGALIGVRQPDGTFVEQTRTGPDGTWTLPFEAPAVYTVMGLPSKPGERCSHAWRVLSSDGGESRVTVAAGDFEVKPVCPVSVVVLGVEGQPVEGAVVEWSTGGSTQEVAPDPTDAAGRTHLAGVSCGVVGFRAHTTGFVNDDASSSIQVPARQSCNPIQPRGAVCTDLQPEGPAPEIVLHLQAARRVRGTVTSSDGQPIAGASVQDFLNGDSTTTDASGRYLLDVAPGSLKTVTLTAAADGHMDQATGIMVGGVEQGGTGTVRVIDGEWHRDFALAPSREVEVRCLGISDSACALLQVGWRPAVGKGARTEDCTPRATVLCQCPADGEVVVEGGGVSVRVADGDDLAWLDLRPYTGAISGRVEGAEGCRVQLRRSDAMQRHFRDQPNGLRRARCQADGSFEFTRLPPGEWTVEVWPSRRGASGDGLGMSVWKHLTDGVEVDVDVESDPVDIGVVSLSEDG